MKIYSERKIGGRDSRPGVYTAVDGVVRRISKTTLVARRKLRRCLAQLCGTMGRRARRRKLRATNSAQGLGGLLWAVARGALPRLRGGGCLKQGEGSHGDFHGEREGSRGCA